jgi:lysophospholipase L1-like esterase
LQANNIVTIKNLVDYTDGGDILAFGDSLTYGLFLPTITKQNDPNYRIRGSFHPYAMKLAELLKNKTRIIVAGVPAETTDSMVMRLPSELSKLSNVRLVIILGGTNDLGMKAPDRYIMSNLEKMHKLALSHANNNSDIPVYTIAITIPQSGYALSVDLKSRYVLNKSIRILPSCHHRIALLDLESTFDQNNQTNLINYWSYDRLHFSKVGYDRIGELIYEIMSNFTVNIKSHNHKNQGNGDGSSDSIGHTNNHHTHHNNNPICDDFISI